MPNFQIIRGADNEIEFRGLKGKYMYGFFIGIVIVLVVGLILFVVLPSPTIAGILTVAGFGGVAWTAFKWNNKYGRWGMEKEQILQKLPGFIVMNRPQSLKSPKKLRV